MKTMKRWDLAGGSASSFFVAWLVEGAASAGAASDFLDFLGFFARFSVGSVVEASSTAIASPFVSSALLAFFFLVSFISSFSFSSFFTLLLFLRFVPSSFPSPTMFTSTSSL